MFFNHLAFKKLITDFCIINILIDVARKGEKRLHSGFWWENLKERYNLEDLGIDRSIMLS
jgi:hypothetical protein